MDLLTGCATRTQQTNSRGSNARSHETGSSQRVGKKKRGGHMRTTTNDIAISDQTGTLAVVTGANSGIGFGVSQRLAAAGAMVILAVRNTDKGNQAAQAMRAASPDAQVVVEQLDLPSLASIEAFADRLLTRDQPINTFINNAGIMTPPTRHLTTDGLELQFGTNCLGHFALTGRLLPLLRKAGASRVVTSPLVVGGG